MSSNLLTSASACYISNIVIAYKTNKVLHLNGNNLQNANALSAMLRNTAIEELYLHGNNLNTSTAISIFKALKRQYSSQLKMLSLMHNDIQDEASDEIGSTLQVNKPLDALWLNQLAKKQH